MSLRVNVQGGTSGGTRKPYAGGHAPTCACTRCSDERRIAAAYERGRADAMWVLGRSPACDGNCDDTALD